MTENLIRKVTEGEVKKLSERTYEFTASTSEQDRDGEVIDALGWDLRNFKKNPVIMYAHDYRTLPVGRAPRVWVSHDGKLRNTVEFPPEGTYEFADIVERLVDTGYLRTESVGFIPKKWEDGDGEKAPKRTYTRQELLEISIVPVPSNPDALRDAITEGVITTKEFDILSKPEETEDYIRIPVRGEEGKHEGHRIRTITLDADKGIKALYCGECKKIITYLFAKAKGWTMESARAWVREHEGKSLLDQILEEEDSEGETIEQKSVIPYRETPKADEGADWDAGKEVKEADVEDLKIMCTLVQGDPDNKTSYRLPHHRASGSHPVVWRGVAAAGAVLMGARGGVNASPEEIAGAKGHLGKHYKQFDKEPPWEKGISQAEIRDEFDYVKSLLTEEMGDETRKQAWEIVRQIMRLPGNDMPVDILEKVGAVLNRKNRERLEQIKGLAQEVIDSAEPEPEQESVSNADIARMVKEELETEIARLKGKV